MTRYKTETKTVYAGWVKMVIKGTDIDEFVIDFKEKEEDVNVDWVVDEYKKYLNCKDDSCNFLDINIVNDIYNTPGNRLIVPFENIDFNSVGTECVVLEKYTPGKTTPNW